jgi:TP901 family phage tail tape measure protein
MADSRRVRIVIDADVAAALLNMRRAEEGLGRIGSAGQQAGRQTSTFSETLKAGLGAAGVVGGIASVVGGFQQIIDKGLNYERSMHALQAVSGATAAQMTAVGDKAKALGNDITIPGASASDAAEAMTELAKGGLSVDQSMAAATGTLRLATAAQVSGADAAQIQANALNSFRLSADQADHVSDLLANSANAASGEVTDMAAALQQSATVAAGFGISIDETTTTLALFAKNGIMGSDAGTSFKTMLTQLASPTDKQAAALKALNVTVYDAQGKFVGMQAVTEQLAAAKGKLTTAEYNAAASTAFGTDAIRAANILGAEGTKGWEEMATAVGKAGGAQELAAAQSQGFSGALDRLGNAFDAAALTAYEQLAPALTGIVDAGASMVGFIGDAVDAFGKLETPVKAGVLALGGLILLRGPLNTLFLQGVAGYQRLGIAAMGTAAQIRASGVSMSTFATVAKGAMSALGGPIGLAIIGVTTALTFMSDSTDEATVSTASFTGAIDENTGALTANADSIIAKAAADAGSFDAVQAIGGSVETYTKALKESASGIKDNVGAQNEMNNLLLNAAASALDASGSYGQFRKANAGTKVTLQEYASSVLAGTEENYKHSDSMDAVIRASQQYASDTQNLDTLQRHATQTQQSGAVATADAGKAAEDATAKTSTYGDALKAMRDATSEADSASQYLNIALLQLAGSDVSAEQAARANEAAMRDIASASRDAASAHDKVSEAQAKLTELTAHLGTTLDGEEASATNLVVTQHDLDEATRAVQDAKADEASASDRQKDAQDKAAQSARDMTAAAYNNAVQTKGTEAAIAAATKTMEGQRKKFIESAVAAGVERGEAEKLADAQGLIPKNVATAYASPGIDEAFAKIQKVNSELAKIDGKTFKANIEAGYTNVEGNYTAEAQAKRNGLADGGPVIGMGGPRQDNIPIWASNGEYMINARSYAKHAPLVHAINADKLADGGPIGRPDVSALTQLTGATKGADAFMQSVWSALDDSMAKAAAKAAVSVSGFNSSQDPSSFGWQRAANIQPFSWDGFTAFVAGGTQGLWKSLLDSIAPTIPGGVLTLGGFEDRDNVNSPGRASFHAYGLAMDVNGAQNPNGVDPRSIQGGFGVIPIGPARSAAGRLGMLWGGDFTGTKDPMHFEIHVPPSGIGGGATGSGGGLFSGGAGVERWRSTALQALADAGESGGYVDDLLRQMSHESSGDPTARNLTDRNAVAGYPSTGLMQVIRPTFVDTLTRHGFGSLIPRGLTDPYTNILASVLYTKDRYGDLGYWARNGFGAYDNGGPMPPGFTMAYNGTDKSEMVLTNNQWATARAALGQVTGNAAANNVTVNARVFVGDREITDIVRVETDAAFGQFAAAVNRTGGQSA